MQTVGFPRSPSICQQQPFLSVSSLRTHLDGELLAGDPWQREGDPGPPSLPSTPKAQGGSCSKTPAPARVPATVTERLPFGPNHRCPFSPAQLQKSGFIFLNAHLREAKDGGGGSKEGSGRRKKPPGPRSLTPYPTESNLQRRWGGGGRGRSPR